MLRNAGFFNRFRSSRYGMVDVEPDSDKPLNFRRDQLPNIKGKLRHLDMERGLDLAMTATALMLMGSGLGLLMTRRYRLASILGIAFIVQQALEYRRISRLDANETELERRALKLERGDFGKLEVIPFR